MAKIAYDDKMINDFLELAEEIGITKTMRELGYPKSWGTAQRWAELRGIVIPVDDVMAKAASTREWYKAEEVMTVAQQGFSRVYEELTNRQDLTPDDQKKLAEALQKHFNVWSAAQGKVQAITETRKSDTMDENLLELLNMEKAKNTLAESSTSVDNAFV